MQQLTAETPPNGLGGKAGHVQWLIVNGNLVPPTWVLAPDVDVESSNLAGLGDGPFAVRSSANVEDGSQHSYAGQFLTLLDVPSSELRLAIDSVRNSVDSVRAASYRERGAAGDPAVTMSVLVQPMVPPKVSGVAFSRNPLTGLNEVVVEAVRGRGDALVGEGITPQRWIHRWGDWRERPAGDPILDDSVVASVVADTSEIAEAFGAPVDLEWVWDGERVWWVQLRPITGLDDVAVYSNRISREVMPGIIKPLIWSVNVPMVNQAWIRLFTEAIGPNDLRPEDLARAFAFRSYFNMSAIGDIFQLLGMPRDSLELLLGFPPGSEQPSFKPTAATFAKLPRMVATTAGKMRYGRIVPREVAGLRAAYEPYESNDLTARSDDALLADIDRLIELGTQAAYVNIVTPLLANVYHTLLRRRLRKAGLDADHVDIGEAELADVSPNIHLERLAAKVAELDPHEADAARRGGYGALPVSLRADVDDFLQRFGHLSDSGNDFSVPPWRENPDHVVSMILNHAATVGDSQRVPWHEAEARLGVGGRAVGRLLQRRTVAFIQHREVVSAAYTQGYGLFRRYFLEIGTRLSGEGLLGAPDDVMYLYLDEVRGAIGGAASGAGLADVVDARRAEIAAAEGLVMPEVIYGDDFVPAPPAEVADRLEGIPTSRGHYRGPLRVVRGMDDFDRVLAGDVIAIPYSDVGWTPLFARAGAVVAAAGGMLSHSSIVAREYRIPCVVSVDAAMRLPEGAIVTVDGYRGVVSVERQQ